MANCARQHKDCDEFAFGHLAGMRLLVVIQGGSPSSTRATIGQLPLGELLTPARRLLSNPDVRGTKWERQYLVGTPAHELTENT